MTLRKTYLAKFFDQDGATLRRVFTCDRSDDGSISPMSSLKSVPTFSARMNGGLGECILDLRARFDDFEEGAVVDFMKVVTVDCVVTDLGAKTQTTTRIYKGFVSRYEPYVEGGDEGVRVTLLGLVSLLSLSLYGSATTYAVTHTGDDPEEIAQDVIDNFNAAFSGSLIGYSGSTSTVGTSVTFTFTEQTWLQAIQKAAELAGAGWWWAVRADGKLYFQAKPVSATHTFTIGKDVVSMRVTRDSEKVKNEVVVERSGGTRKTYADATSKATYGTGSPATGRRTLLIKDSSLANEATQDQRGNKELADSKDARNAATLVVGPDYPIESILVGQTCKVRNFHGSASFLSDNMQVVGTSYRGDTVEIQLEQHSADFGLALAAFVS